MTKVEVALQVFLKRMPHGPLTDATQAGYVSAAEQAVEIAELFLSAVRPKDEQHLSLPFPESEL